MFGGLNKLVVLCDLCGWLNYCFSSISFNSFSASFFSYNSRRLISRDVLNDSNLLAISFAFSIFPKSL